MYIYMCVWCMNVSLMYGMFKVDQVLVCNGYLCMCILQLIQLELTISRYLYWVLCVLVYISFLYSFFFTQDVLHPAMPPGKQGYPSVP